MGERKGKEIVEHLHLAEASVPVRDRQASRQSHANDLWRSFEGWARFPRPGCSPDGGDEPPVNRHPHQGADWWTRLRKAADAARFDRTVVVRGEDLRKLIAYTETETRHGDMLWDALRRVRADEDILDGMADVPHGEVVKLNVTMGVLRYLRTVRALVGRHRGAEGRCLPLSDAMICGRELAIAAYQGFAVFVRGAA